MNYVVNAKLTWREPIMNGRTTVQIVPAALTHKCT